MTKRIFLVDDHPVFRDGLRQLIATDRQLAVCGEAGTAEEALGQIPVLQPDLVITDITLPGKSGLEMLRELQILRPEMPVLVISMHEEAAHAGHVLRAGGRGYIMKKEGPGKLLEAIQRVLQGKVALSDKMFSQLLESIARPHSTAATEAELGALTSREFEVFRLIGEGRDTRGIAGSLRMSVKTVDTHRAHIREKLGLKNNTELIRHAVQWLEGEK